MPPDYPHFGPYPNFSPRPAAQRRYRNVLFRATDAEQVEVHRLADLRGLSLSDYLRSLIAADAVRAARDVAEHSRPAESPSLAEAA